MERSNNVCDQDQPSGRGLDSRAAVSTGNGNRRQQSDAAVANQLNNGCVFADGCFWHNDSSLSAKWRQTPNAAETFFRPETFRRSWRWFANPPNSNIGCYGPLPSDDSCRLRLNVRQRRRSAMPNLFSSIERRAPGASSLVCFERHRRRFCPAHDSLPAVSSGWVILGKTEWQP